MRSIVMGLVFAVWVSPFGCAAGAEPATIELLWDKSAKREGAAFDRVNKTLIVGGSVNGPSTKGGSAEWEMAATSGRIVGLQLTLYTNGGTSSTWGKGIHATRKGGDVKLFVNDTEVHTIVCDELGEYGDYWPNAAPVSSPHYKTGKIDLSKAPIKGPALKVTIKVSPNTVVDVHKIVIAPTFE